MYFLQWRHLKFRLKKKDRKEGSDSDSTCSPFLFDILEEDKKIAAARNNIQGGGWEERKLMKDPSAFKATTTLNQFILQFLHAATGKYRAMNNHQQ